MLKNIPEELRTFKEEEEIVVSLYHTPMIGLVFFPPHHLHVSYGLLALLDRKQTEEPKEFSEIAESELALLFAAEFSSYLLDTW